MVATARVEQQSGMVAVRLLIAFAMALLVTGMLTHGAWAADNGAAMDKNAFKSGCESGGGSYIENNDGSFQCNLKDGGVIKCPSATSQCTYTPPLRVVNQGNVVATNGGMMQSQPAVTPTPTSPIRQTYNKAPASVTFQAVPSPTPAP